MTTLRRELKKRLEEVFKKYKENYQIKGTYGVYEFEFIESLTNAALEAIRDDSKPKVDLSRTDPAWLLFSNGAVNQEELDEANFVKQALEAFEIDMGTPDNWNWYPARTSEDSAWKVLRDFIVAQYKLDKKCFEKYQTWRTQPYARGAMSNLAIKRRPEEFPASWSDFLASNAMYGKPSNQVDRDGWELDDHGAPISYV